MNLRRHNYCRCARGCLAFSGVIMGCAVFRHGWVMGTWRWCLQVFVIIPKYSHSWIMEGFGVKVSSNSCKLFCTVVNAAFRDFSQGSKPNPKNHDTKMSADSAFRLLQSDFCFIRVCFVASLLPNCSLSERQQRNEQFIFFPKQNSLYSQKDDSFYFICLFLQWRGLYFRDHLVGTDSFYF